MIVFVQNTFDILELSYHFDEIIQILFWANVKYSSQLLFKIIICQKNKQDI